MKSAHDQCGVFEDSHVNIFTRHYYHSDITSVNSISSNKFCEYFTKSWEMDSLSMVDCEIDLINENVNSPVYKKMTLDRLTNAVRKRLMADVPYGVLLSGG